MHKSNRHQKWNKTSFTIQSGIFLVIIITDSHTLSNLTRAKHSFILQCFHEIPKIQVHFWSRYFLIYRIWLLYLYFAVSARGVLIFMHLSFHEIILQFSQYFKKISWKQKNLKYLRNDFPTCLMQSLFSDKLQLFCYFSKAFKSFYKIVTFMSQSWNNFSLLLLILHQTVWIHMINKAVFIGKKNYVCSKYVYVTVCNY